MSVQKLFENIADFLSEPPEWVENWLATPVKKKPSIDIPEIAISFFNNLPIEDFNKSLKINRDWYKECRRELRERRKFAVKKYWETVEEYKKANRVLKKCWETGEVTQSQIEEYRNKKCEMYKRRSDDFEKWIDVEEAWQYCRFKDLIDPENSTNYFEMHCNFLDPYENNLEEIKFLHNFKIRWGIEDFSSNLSSVIDELF